MNNNTKRSLQVCKDLEKKTR